MNKTTQLIMDLCSLQTVYVMVSNDNKMADEGCFALSVFGLLNDVTFHMAKCCAEVNTDTCA